jgi:hypothetical protein
MRIAVIFSIVVATIFVQCSKDPTSSYTVVNSEVWRLNDVGTQNYADITLSELSNGAYLAQGSWYYTFFGNKITCAIAGGSATIVDSAVNISASGTASYPPDSSGYFDSSPFNLQMTGIFKSGSSQGTWEIHFADTSWEGWIDPGHFSGTKQSGTGVTEL